MYHFLLLLSTPLLSLNQNLTYRWNPTTDYFEYYVNGSWVQDRYAGFNGAYVIKDGELSSLLGVALPKAAFPDTGGAKVVPTSYGKSGNYYVISMNAATAQPSGILLFSDAIDLSIYKGVKITYVYDGDASWNTLAEIGISTSKDISGDCSSYFTNLEHIGGGVAHKEQTEHVVNFSSSSGAVWLGFAVRAYGANCTLKISKLELIKR